MSITTEDLHSFADNYLMPFGMRVLVALAIFVLGRWAARMLTRVIDGVMARSHVDVSLRKFLGDVLYAAFFVVVMVVALDSLGVKTTAVVAALGAAGLAIGLALQGSLSNFAAGVMLIVLRPYKVNDLVTIGKYLGRVDAIKVFNTILVTGDHREITIPNGQIITQPIENLTVLGRRRVDLVVTINQVVDPRRAHPHRAGRGDRRRGGDRRQHQVVRAAVDGVRRLRAGVDRRDHPHQARAGVEEPQVRDRDAAHDVAASHTQPTRNATPPNGVMKPSAWMSVPASAYKLPENSTMPSWNRSPARAAPGMPDTSAPVRIIASA
jgi:hypothetical protein